MRNWIPLIGFALLVMAFMVGLTRNPAILKSNLINTPLPAFNLSDLYAPETQITNFDLIKTARQTGKPFLINVFGSWCQACIVEHSFLISLAQEIDIIGLNWRDEIADAHRFLARLGDPYRRVMVDSDSDLAIAMGVTGAPETYLVSPDGIILQKYIGPLNADIWRSHFERSLAEWRVAQ